MVYKQSAELVKKSQLNNERYDWVWGAKRTRYAELLEYYKQYRSITNTSDSPFDTTLFMGLQFATVETIKPRILNALFGKMPYLNVKPSRVISPNDYEEAKLQAKRVQAELNYQCDFPLFYIIMSDWITQALWFGTSPLKVFWKRDVVDKQFYKPFVNKETGAVSVTKETRPVVLWDDIYFEVVNQRNLFTPGDEKDIEKKDFVIEQRERTIDYIKRNKKYNKEAVAALAEIYTGTGDEYTNYQAELRERMEARGLSWYPGQPNYRKTMLLECFDKETNTVTVQDYATGIVLYDNINVYCETPYININATSVPFEDDGIGAIEPSFDVQQELNYLHNLSLMSLRLRVVPLWLADYRANLNEDYLVGEPGRVFNVLDVNSVKPLESGNVHADEFWRMVDGLFSMQVKVSGATDNSRGIEGPNQANTTAAGMAMMQEQANIRYREYVNIIKHSGVDAMGEKMIRINQIMKQSDRFIPDARKYTRGNEEILFTTPEDFYRNYKVSVGSTARVEFNSSIRQQMIQDLLAIVSKIDPMRLQQESPNEMVMLGGLIKNIMELNEIPESEVFRKLGVANEFSINQAQEMMGALTTGEMGAGGMASNPPMPQANTNMSAMIQPLAQRGTR